MPIARSDAYKSGSIVGTCRATGTRSDAGGACGCHCCGSGNQCLFIPDAGDFLHPEQFTPEELNAIAASIPAVGFTNGYTKLGSAFDVVSEINYWRQLTSTEYPAGIDTYPNGAIHADRFDRVTMQSHRARYRLVEASLNPDEVLERLGDPAGNGWIAVFVLSNNQTGLPSSIYYMDADPLVGSWERSGFSSNNGAGPLGAGSGMGGHLDGLMPVTNDGLSKMLVLQSNALGQINPGKCDGLAWNPIPYFDAANPASPLKTDQVAGGFGYWNDPLYHFPGVGPSGAELQDQVSGPAQLALHRQGGGYSANPQMVLLDFSQPDNTTVDYIQTIARTINGSVVVDHAITNSSLVANAGVNGELIIIDNDDLREIWGPIEYSASINITTRVERITPCSSDDDLENFDCSQQQLVARVATICSVPEDPSIPRMIGYNPLARPNDGVTIIHRGAVYRPTDIPTLLPIAPAIQWSPSVCDLVNLLAVPCDGQGEMVAFDPSTRPPDAVTFFVEAIQYTPTLLATGLPAVAADWSTFVCPDSSGHFKAYRCAGRPVSAILPDVISYNPNVYPFDAGSGFTPGVDGIGLVQVRQTSLGMCVAVAEYISTIEPTPPITLSPIFITKRHSESPCQPDFSDCVGLDDGDPIFGPNSMDSKIGSNAHTMAVDEYLRLHAMYYGCDGCG